MRALLGSSALCLCAWGIAFAQDQTVPAASRRSFDFTAPDPAQILANPASNIAPRPHLRDFGPDEVAEVKPQPAPADPFEPPDPSKILPNPKSAIGPRPYFRNFGLATKLGSPGTNYGSVDVNGHFSEVSGGGSGDIGGGRAGRARDGGGRQNGASNAQRANAIGQPRERSAEGAGRLSGAENKLTGLAPGLAHPSPQADGETQSATATEKSDQAGSSVKSGTGKSGPEASTPRTPPRDAGAVQGPPDQGVKSNAGGTSKDRKEFGQGVGRTQDLSDGGANIPAGTARTAANGKTGQGASSPAGADQTDSGSRSNIGASDTPSGGASTTRTKDGTQLSGRGRAGQAGEGPSGRPSVEQKQGAGSETNPQLASGDVIGRGEASSRPSRRGSQPGMGDAGASGATPARGAPAASTSAGGSVEQPASDKPQAPGRGGLAGGGLASNGNQAGDAASGEGEASSRPSRRGSGTGAGDAGASGATPARGAPAASTGAGGSAEQPASDKPQAPGRGGLAGGGLPSNSNQAGGAANGEGRPGGSAGASAGGNKSPGLAGAQGATNRGGGVGNTGDLATGGGDQAEDGRGHSGARANATAGNTKSGQPGNPSQGGKGQPAGRETAAAARGETASNSAAGSTAGAPSTGTSQSQAQTPAGGSTSEPGAAGSSGSSASASLSSGAGTSSSSAGATGDSPPGVSGKRDSAPSVSVSPGRIMLGGAYAQLQEVWSFGGRRFDTAIAKPRTAPPVPDLPKPSPAVVASNDSAQQPAAAPVAQSRLPAPAISETRKNAVGDSPGAVSAKPQAKLTPGASGADKIATVSSRTRNALNPVAPPERAPPKDLQSLSAAYSQVDWRQFDLDAAAVAADPPRGRDEARRRNLKAGLDVLDAYSINKNEIASQLISIKRNLDRLQQLQEARVAIQDRAALEGRYAIAGSPVAANRGRGAEDAAAAVSSDELEGARVIAGIDVLAKDLGWSPEKRAHLKDALYKLDLDADPSPSGPGKIFQPSPEFVEELWHKIEGRGAGQALVRDAGRGDGPGLAGAAAGQQGQYEDCTIFALANAAGLPYGVVAARADETISHGQWRSAGERSNPQQVIEKSGLNGGEVVMLAEAFGGAEVVFSSDFAKVLKEGRTILVNVEPGHQVVLSKAFRHEGETWFEMVDSHQGPMQRLYVSSAELNSVLRENGIAFAPERGTTVRPLRDASPGSSDVDVRSSRSEPETRTRGDSARAGLQLSTPDDAKLLLPREPGSWPGAGNPGEPSINQLRAPERYKSSLEQERGKFPQQREIIDRLLSGMDQLVIAEIQKRQSASLFALNQHYQKKADEVLAPLYAETGTKSRAELYALKERDPELRRKVDERLAPIYQSYQADKEATQARAIRELIEDPGPQILTEMASFEPDKVRNASATLDAQAILQRQDSDQAYGKMRSALDRFAKSGIDAGLASHPQPSGIADHDPAPAVIDEETGRYRGYAGVVEQLEKRQGTASPLPRETRP